MKSPYFISLREVGKFTGKFILYWWLQFVLARIIFFFYFLSKFPSPRLLNLFVSIFHGFKMDLSVIGYLSILPLLVLLLQLFIKKQFFPVFLFCYTALVLLINSLFTGSDLGLYDAWGTKLNQRAIEFLMYPAEAAASTGDSPVVLLLFISAVEMMIGLLLFKVFFKKRYRRIENMQASKMVSVPAVLICLPIAVLMMRGGLQKIPITESSAYYSSTPILNHEAVNTAWTFIHSVSEIRNPLKENPYPYFPMKEAKQLKENYYQHPGDSLLHILSIDKPNIVYIQLESFTADVIEALGAEKGITPFLSTLIDSSLLFSNIYSSGFRTDQGIVTMLSAFPAQPNVSIIRLNDKSEKLHTLTEKLTGAGYHSSFFYGGEMDFANMKAYVLHNGFEHIFGKDDYPASESFSEWGIPDGPMLMKQVKFLNTQQTPFFSYFVTLSSHEPFDVPMKDRFSGKDHAEKFKNSCYYTDQSLKFFFEEAKKQSWYKNTLFVLVADHGHKLPLNRNEIEPARYHIPLIFAGDVIAKEFRGKKMETLGSQLDILVTLLAQLNISASGFEWSNNLLNAKRKPFVYYTYDDGFGMITPSDTFVFDNRARMVYFPYRFRNQPLTPSITELLKYGKALQQVVYQQYMDY